MLPVATLYQPYLIWPQSIPSSVIKEHFHKFNTWRYGMLPAIFFNATSVILASPINIKETKGDVAGTVENASSVMASKKDMSKLVKFFTLSKTYLTAWLQKKC